MTVVRPPENVNVPTISGLARDEELLQGQRGEWRGTQPITYAYQWESCASDGGSCSLLEGETEPTVELRSQDVGRRLRLRVTATNAGGRAEASSTLTDAVAALAPRADGPPDVAGFSAVGEPVHATVGFWTGSRPLEYRFQWLRCPAVSNALAEQCLEIVGATSRDYTPTVLDSASTLRVRVTATNPAGNAAQTSAPTAAVGTDPRTIGSTAEPEMVTVPLVDRLEDAIQFRRDFGLSTDNALVERLEQDPSFSEVRQRYSVPLLPLEARSVDSRERFIEQVDVVDTYGASNADVFAGSYVDHPAGGIVRVGFTALRG